MAILLPPCEKQRYSICFAAAGIYFFIIIFHVVYIVVCLCIILLVFFFRRLIHEPPQLQLCFSLQVTFRRKLQEEVGTLVLHSPTVTCIYRVFRDTMRTTPRQGRIPLVCLFVLIFCTGVNVAAVKAKAASSLRPDELQLDVTYNEGTRRKCSRNTWHSKGAKLIGAKSS